MQLHISVYDKRIDMLNSGNTPSFAGFYSATFVIEYHEDTYTRDTPRHYVIDRVTLHAVDYSPDKPIEHDDRSRIQYLCERIPMMLKAHILAETDIEDIKQRAMDKAGMLSSNSFRELI